ncbi:GABA permease [Trichophyton tonsurans CBS 112818]|uniref:GABA permease n=1 Tax=Trichophyton tonsurans (strain CBS 112818) TaxID=647933 RepID=F2S834_TRIT1|nr:GABA permease [Trichophyton tonsurans CBS 112818]
MSSDSISTKRLKSAEESVGHPEEAFTYDEQHQHVPAKYMGTSRDRDDMCQLGKTQVLRRNFRFVSILGFACTLIATWEVVLSLLGFALLDGGTAGLIWGFLAVSCGFSLVFASLAEIASMSPTAGGQYHWVSEFAPPSCQNILAISQCAIVTIAFLAGTIIQGLLILNLPEYIPQRWHGTLLVIAISAFSIIFNTFLAKKLPLVEALLLLLHIIGIIAIIVPLVVLAPRSSAEVVFTQFNNGGGWSTAGVAVMVGLPPAIASMIGYDCAVHMAEEIKDASKTLPQAMMSAVGVNFVLGLAVILTICFTVGDIEAVLASPTGIPFIQIFFNATKSHAATNAMTSIVVITLVASTITEVATASRQTWSFARDRGVPFADFLSHVNPSWNIPLHAVIVSLVVTILLALINVGSTTALNAITSLTVASLMSAYLISIGCILLKRIRGEALPSRRWSLGIYGGFINAAAMLFLFPLFVFSFFPLTKEVDATTMNWSSLIYVSVILFATVYYFAYGKKTYVPPSSLVRRPFKP